MLILQIQSSTVQSAIADLEQQLAAFTILASKANTATVQLIKTCMHLCYQLLMNFFDTTF